MRVFPITRFRPTRASDGEGGWTETVGEGATVYGAIHVHKAQILLLIDFQEDVIVGDFLEVDDGTSAPAFYRVIERERLLGSAVVQMVLERTQRPISPVRPRYLLSGSGYRIVASGGGSLVY